MALSLQLGAVAPNARRPVLYWTAGETGRAMEFAIKADGVVVNLGGYGAAYLSAEIGGAWLLDLAELTIDDGDDGTLQITPSSAQVATAGDYNARIRLVDGGAVTYTEPFTINVQASGENTATLTWSQIAVLGRRGTSPMGTAITTWAISATIGGTIVGGRTTLRQTSFTDPSDYLNVAAVNTDTLGGFITSTYLAGLVYTLDFDDVVFDDGSMVVNLPTGIIVDCANFGSAGGHYVYTPSDLDGTPQAYGDDPDPDWPEPELT